MLVEMMLLVILDEWNFFLGWIKYVYGDEGLVIFLVDVLEDDVLIFDVEVCMKEGLFFVIVVVVFFKVW